MFARIQARASAIEERRGGAERRRQLLRGLSGRVVEVGAGTGVSFAYYPSSVSELIAIEPEPALRERAVQAALGAPIPVQVLDGVAERIPVPDASVDAAVFAGVLCSVADPRRVLEEARRVLRPGWRTPVLRARDRSQRAPERTPAPPGRNLLARPLRRLSHHPRHGAHARSLRFRHRGARAFLVPADAPRDARRASHSWPSAARLASGTPARLRGRPMSRLRQREIREPDDGDRDHDHRRRPHLIPGRADRGE